MTPETDAGRDKRSRALGGSRRSPERWLFGLAAILAALGAALALPGPIPHRDGPGQVVRAQPVVLPPEDGEAALPPRPDAIPSPHSIDGTSFTLSIPRLGYTAVVHEGVSADILAKGPGRYTELGWPGQDALVAVAAHNNYWLRLDELQPGDEVTVETYYGSYWYAVTRKRIVDPGDRSVLVSTAEHRLTLTTCWPLWAGAWATQRLIVETQETAGYLNRDVERLEQRTG